MNDLNCKICGFEGTTLKNLSIHLASSHQLSIVEYAIQHDGFIKPICKCGKECSYKSGLSFRKTCGGKECVSKQASTRNHSEETKALLREKRLAWMKENPEKTAWRLGNKPSWPEKFFFDTCQELGILNNREVVREKSVFPYFIDFAFTNEMIAVEIDGSQHKNMVERDKKRDDFLRSKGWTVYRIDANLLYDQKSRKDVVKNFGCAILGEISCL